MAAARVTNTVDGLVKGGYSEADIERLIADNFDQLFGRNYHLMTRQMDTDTGRLDMLVLLTMDQPRARCHIVVEIKKGKASDNAIGQVLRYMAYLQRAMEVNCQIYEKNIVKGMIICEEADLKLVRAAQAVGTVELWYYSLHPETGLFSLGRAVELKRAVTSLQTGEPATIAKVDWENSQHDMGYYKDRGLVPGAAVEVLSKEGHHLSLLVDRTHRVSVGEWDLVHVSVSDDHDSDFYCDAYKSGIGY